MDILSALTPEMLLLIVLTVGMVTLGFVYGSTWVSEVALGVALAHMVMQFAPLAKLPSVFGTLFGLVPFVPAEAVLFVVLALFGWWVSRSTVLVVDTASHLSKILTASCGAVGIIFLALSHTISLGTMYAPGTIAASIFGSPLEALLFVVASLSLIGLSRKM